MPEGKNKNAHIYTQGINVKMQLTFLKISRFLIASFFPSFIFINVFNTSSIHINFFLYLPDHADIL